MNIKTLKTEIAKVDETVKQLRLEVKKQIDLLSALHRQFIEETVRTAQLKYANDGAFTAIMRDDLDIVDFFIGEDASAAALKYAGQPVRVERVCDDYILIEGSPYALPTAYLDGASIGA